MVKKSGGIVGNAIRSLIKAIGEPDRRLPRTPPSLNNPSVRAVGLSGARARCREPGRQITSIRWENWLAGFLATQERNAHLQPAKKCNMMVRCG
jgi:hypothetical protein